MRASSAEIGGDLRFEARFADVSAVPEPSSLLLLAGGLAALGVGALIVRRNA